jgi:hypothetical protein
MGIMGVNLFLRGVEKGSVVEGSVTHGWFRREKSVSHGRTAAEHHDDHRGAESERKNGKPGKKQKLVAASWSHRSE